MRPYLAKIILFGFLLGYFPAGALTAQGQTVGSSSHTVTIGVSPITVMSVSGNPAPFLVDRQEGDTGGSVTDASTFYNVTTNMPNVYLTASLDFSMPEGTSLLITGESVLGNSHGVMRLTSGGEEVHLASGISRGLENGRGLEYRFEYDDAALDIPFQSRNVTFSLVDAASNSAHQVVSTVYFGINPTLSIVESSSSSER